MANNFKLCYITFEFGNGDKYYWRFGYVENRNMLNKEVNRMGLYDASAALLFNTSDTYDRERLSEIEKNFKEVNLNYAIDELIPRLHKEREIQQNMHNRNLEPLAYVPETIKIAEEKAKERIIVDIRKYQDESEQKWHGTTLDSELFVHGGFNLLDKSILSKYCKRIDNGGSYAIAFDSKNLEALLNIFPPQTVVRYMKLDEKSPSTHIVINKKQYLSKKVGQKAETKEEKVLRKTFKKFL